MVNQFKERLPVAVGILLDEQQEHVLVAKRPEHWTLPGYWEFPGGKVKPNESIKEALVREFFEEVGIKVLSAKPIMTISHQYTERLVELHVYHILKYNGDAEGREGQEIKWQTPNALSELQFPEANKKIIEYVMGLKSE